MCTLYECLAEVNDPRRGQGKRYDLPHMLLYCVLGVASGATSYRRLELFLSTHWQRLNTVFGSTWKRAPAYTAVRKILLGLDCDDLERALRKMAAEQVEQMGQPDGPRGWALIALDGKSLRGSADHFEDRRAAQVFSALAVHERLVLGRITMEEVDKDHEIPAGQRLISELGLGGCMYTLDALHLQKKQLSTS